MKNLYRLFRRNGIYYAENTRTRQQHSLRTSDAGEASRLLNAKNEAAVVPMMNLALGKTYLAAYDPKMVTRTWAYVMFKSTTGIHKGIEGGAELLAGGEKVIRRVLSLGIS
jgi:hypothetical protein